MITQQINFDDWWMWLQKSEGYRNCFTLYGAQALYEYMEELSDQVDEPAEFDPISWCCAFSEYASFEQFQHDTGYTQDGVDRVGYPDIETLEDLRGNTTVIDTEDGGLIVGEF